jgi:hypothetical protein
LYASDDERYNAYWLLKKSKNSKNSVHLLPVANPSFISNFPQMKPEQKTIKGLTKNKMAKVDNHPLGLAFIIYLPLSLFS